MKFYPQKLVQKILCSFKPLILGVKPCYFMVKVCENKKDYWATHGSVLTDGTYLSILTQEPFRVLSYYYKIFGIFIICPKRNDKMVMRRMKLLEKTSDLSMFHAVLGGVGGYPNCCIKNYVEKASGVKNFGGATTKVAKDYLEKLGGKKDVFGIKIRDKLVVLGDLQYIPCSVNSKESLKKLRVLKKKMKKFEEMIKL